MFYVIYFRATLMFELWESKNVTVEKQKDTTEGLFQMPECLVFPLTFLLQYVTAMKYFTSSVFAF